MEFLAERSDEFSLAIKDNHSVLQFGRHRAVFYVNQPGRVDGNSVRILPVNVFRDLHAIMVHLVPVAVRADDRRLRTALVLSAKNARSRTGKCHAAGRCQKTAS